MIKRTLAACAAAALAGVPILFGSGAAHAAGGATMYNSIPSPLPGNLPSVGAEAYAFKEFGNQITFAAGTPRSPKTVVVTMSSWGCQTGHWGTGGNCSTNPGATFSLPITFNIYNVGSGPEAGSLLATQTQTFAIPYRPSADPVHCTGGRWYQASTGTCFNGLAVNISFDFSGQNVTLPDNVVYGIAYNTSHYGYNPVGEDAACYTSSGGCGYDSLNIGLSQEATDVTVGSDPNPGTLYQNSPIASEYCDNGADGTNTFRLDSPGNPCWAPFTPAVQFIGKVGPPKSKDQCKDGGWQNFNSPAFKNQGDCVSYVATHGKNT